MTYWVANSCDPDMSSAPWCLCEGVCLVYCATSATHKPPFLSLSQRADVWGPQGLSHSRSPAGVLSVSGFSSCLTSDDQHTFISHIYSPSIFCSVTKCPMLSDLAAKLLKLLDISDFRYKNKNVKIVATHLCELNHIFLARKKIR